ncbi:MAG: exo-alpha-sialidase, partial [Armatimonadota bacterium]|nr:exo-alpha-sialidase [Armatimonadota bacterium]
SMNRTLPDDEPGGPHEPIRIVGPEIAKLNFKRSDGGLERYPGTQTVVIFRANRENPEKSDGRGWTYHHHPELAVWKGRLYVGWNSCEKDEDTWPSRELLSTSTDGEHWTPPFNMFPQGVSTPLRMYFFHAPNGRMLVIAGLRVSRERTSERTKGPLVVREIYTDHTLGPVYTLRAPEQAAEGQPPFYETAPDSGFLVACKQLLGNRLFLEQQDYGNLLPPSERMKWHTLSNWKADEWTLKAAEEFGKALCFFRRADGTLVAVGKKRWVTISRDNGITWSQPVRPPTLITNMGKVWGQRMPSGQYILAYNPHLQLRYPLVVVTSDDGITFSNMRVLHDEIPEVRYPGSAKSRGTSYMRGITLWANDGSRPNDPVWIVYSMNKEEIWMSYLPD